jgi:nucleotide-binding universal stress UspA family protein
MTYKTILAVISAAAEAGSAPLGPIALDLAARWKAHLTVFILVPHITMPVYAGTMDGGVVLLEEDSEGKKRAEQVAQSIERSARANGVRLSTIVASDPFDAITARLVAAGRLHDISLIRQNAHTSQATIEALLFETGRPCLLCPEGVAAPLDLSRVMIGWDGSLQASRTVFQAMPVLTAAKSVEVVTVTGEKPIDAQCQAADLARFLSEHGITVGTIDLPNAYKTGSMLLDHARTIDATVLMMGAYAHSRLRQFFFGGATSTVLSDAKLPILLGH